jgi:prepilin signal peptidase PulO-like enzyme (type II secretory pathway)
MSLKRLRLGELLALAGAICVIVSLFVRWYEGPIGTLDAWNTFGPSIVLILAAVCAALAMVLAAVTERSPALPVSTAVWCVLLGLLGVIAAAVRAIERPDHATEVCIGVWLELSGAVVILAGAWLVLRDERPSRYRPARPQPRPRP